jgi:large subunit ribosomal protein L25
LELINLKTHIRTSSGNGPAKALRRQGLLPAVLYGRKTEPVLLSVNISDLEQVLKMGAGSQVLLNLLIQNGETSKKTAMIKELQTHPLSRNYLHVDFYEIDMERKIKVRVPVVAKGKSIGVENGGILQIIRREIEVFCLPLEIPESFEVDITALEIGDSVHLDEIPLEGNVEFQEDVNFTILTVVSPKAVEEEVEEEIEEELEEGEEGAAEDEETEEKQEE